MALDRLTLAGKVGLVLHCVALVFFLVGFSVPYWLVADPANVKLRYGLWTRCTEEHGRTSFCNSLISTPLPGVSDTTWFRGVQALECLALIAITGNIVIRALYIYTKARWLCVLSSIVDGVTVAFIFLAATVFGNYTSDLRIYYVKKDDAAPASRHFGFAFNIIGGIFFIGTGVCFIVDLLLRRH